MRTTPFLLAAIAVATLAGCGGKMTDPLAETPGQIATRAAIARCRGSVNDMLHTDINLEERVADGSSLFVGKWARCPAHSAQFNDSFGIVVTSTTICALDEEGGGTTTKATTTCEPWSSKKPGELRLGTSFSTSLNYSADRNLVSLCANPYCAVYSRLDDR